MQTLYITILQNTDTGEELSFGTINKAVKWLHDNHPDIKFSATDVWNTKLYEGNVFEIAQFTIRKIRKINN